MHPDLGFADQCQLVVPSLCFTLTLFRHVVVPKREGQAQHENIRDFACKIRV